MGKEAVTFLPISVNITGKKIVIVGGGKVGYHKAVILRRFTEQATVVSPVFHEGFDELPFRKVKKQYEKKDLEAAFLVYVCTEDPAVNAQVKKDAVELGILTSVCDDPLLCDFVSPAIYKEGHFTIAVSSNAQDVRQSIRIRNRIKELAGEGKITIHSAL